MASVLEDSRHWLIFYALSVAMFLLRSRFLKIRNSTCTIRNSSLCTISQYSGVFSCTVIETFVIAFVVGTKSTKKTDITEIKFLTCNYFQFKILFFSTHLISDVAKCVIYSQFRVSMGYIILNIFSHTLLYEGAAESHPGLFFVLIPNPKTELISVSWKMRIQVFCFV